MTVISSGTNPDGKPFHDVVVYTRVDGEKRFDGNVEEREGEELDTSRTVEFVANGPDGITWVLPEIKAKLELTFDGKDYAPVGPTVPKGLTIAAKRAGDNDLQLC